MSKNADPADDDVIDKTQEPEIEIVKAETPAIKAEDGIAELKKQLETEKSKREAAERQAAELAQREFKARSEVADTNLHLLTNAIETIKGNTQSLKSDYKAAMAAGDFDRAADIQVAMSDNAAKLLQLENGRQAMAEAPKQAAPVVDPVEALARQLTPRSAAWVRSHPECATDPKLYRKMIRAHEDSVDDGLPPDSDEYFQYVEERMGLRAKTVSVVIDDDPTDGAAKVVSKRQSPVSAPVSRSGAAPGSNPRVIRLTPEEVEIARMTGLSEKQYWEQKQKIRTDERYN